MLGRRRLAAGKSPQSLPPSRILDTVLWYVESILIPLQEMRTLFRSVVSMRRNTWKPWDILWAGATSAVLLASCGPASPAVPASRLQDLHRVAELKEHFNRDQGSPRLVLLLSPT